MRAAVALAGALGTAVCGGCVTDDPGQDPIETVMLRFGHSVSPVRGTYCGRRGSWTWAVFADRMEPTGPDPMPDGPVLVPGHGGLEGTSGDGTGVRIALYPTDSTYSMFLSLPGGCADTWVGEMEVTANDRT